MTYRIQTEGKSTQSNRTDTVEDFGQRLASTVSGSFGLAGSGRGYFSLRFPCTSISISRPLSFRTLFIFIWLSTMQYGNQTELAALETHNL